MSTPGGGGFEKPNRKEFNPSAGTGQGVGSATIRKGAKGRPDEQVAQMNVSQALEWFKQAGDAQVAGYTEGLSYYEKAMKGAALEVTAGYKEANQVLGTLSYSSNQAINEQMRMMGLDPISNSVNMKREAKDRGLSADVQAQVAAAEKIKDPIARATALQDMGALISKTTADNITKSEALIKQSSETFTSADASNLAFLKRTTPSYADQEGFRIAGVDLGLMNPGSGGDGGFANLGAFLNNTSARNKPKVDARIAQMEAMKVTADKQKAQASGLVELNAQYDEFGVNYSSMYSPEFDSGYTGSQVEARVAATPGYQFQMGQGTQAIERQGAAKGMLGSGNTLTALTDYGQGLAQNFYGMYMDNLSRIVAEGSPATMQIATNKISEGKDQSVITQSVADVGKSTYGLIGTAKANSLYQQGNLYAQASQFNAQAQQAGIEAAKNRQVAQSTAAMQSVAGIMNAGTNQQKFNYGMAQNQQGGQAFYA